MLVVITRLVRLELVDASIAFAAEFTLFWRSVSTVSQGEFDRLTKNRRANSRALSVWALGSVVDLCGTVSGEAVVRRKVDALLVPWWMFSFPPQLHFRRSVVR